jgi:hypothetical protein
MKISTRPLMAICLAMMCLPCRAQMGMGMRPPDVAGVFNPVVGSGASYEMISKDGRKTQVTMSVVEKDSSGGYWIEYSSRDPNGNPVYMKNLLLRQSDDIVVQHSVVQMQGQPPIEMSQMLSMKKMQSEKQKADFRANAQNLGTESVTTQGGTFSCEHWRSTKDGVEVWLSDKVVPWKLVKMIGTNETLTLVGTISDAKTHITGTPVNIQEMMKQHTGN